MKHFFEEILGLAKNSGLSVKALCEKANVPYSTVMQWKQSPPSAFEVLGKLKQAVTAQTVQLGQIVPWEIIELGTGHRTAKGLGFVSSIHEEEGIYFVEGLIYPVSIIDNSATCGDKKVTAWPSRPQDRIN